MSYLERIQSSGISRRGFVKASAAAAAALSVAGIAGCAPNSVEETAEETAGSERRDLVNGEWKPAACWHNCGGRCVNKVLVRDGVAIRQKTDDSHEDSVDYPQQRGCLRGRSQRKQVFAADRLKYPMKRKNWSPDNPNGELRGKDEWERVSWDEAFRIVGDELRKAYNNYGPRSVFSNTWMYTNVERILCKMGGYCRLVDSSSMGTYDLDATKLGLPSQDYATSLNDRFDLENAEWIVFQGCNPAWSSPGAPNFYYLNAKDGGSKYVMISPSYNATAQLLDAKWIPVRLGTDTAFMLAVAYEMLELDKKEGNIVDWDFLDLYTVGFNSGNMPDDAKLNENFYDYLYGKYDGIPKTAEWASEICGTPVDDIRWYAGVLGKNNKVMMLHGFSFARCHGAESVPQLFMTLGAMGGHFGKSGHACGSTYGPAAANGGPSLVVGGSTGVDPIDNPVDDRLVAPVAWQSIIDGKYRWIGGFDSKGEDRDIDIHVMFWGHSAGLQTTINLRKGIEATRQMDFVFSTAQFMNTQAKYSDIVLPVTTEWERPGSTNSGNRETLFVYTKIIDPLYESKTDWEIGEGIAGALGLDVKEIYPISETQQFMNKLLGAQVMGEDGEMLPLLTITQDDLDSWECEGSPQEGAVDLATFLSDGCYQVPRSKGDGYSFIAYKDYIDNPKENPLPSNSGKFEIYCQWKADTINGFGFSSDIKPYPHYRIPAEGYETCSEDFPFLLYNPHYLRRSHTVFDNVQWLAEAWNSPVYLSRADAESRGVKEGDTVCISTPAGRTLRIACVLETLVPGTVGLPHGAWIDLDENEEYDLAGSDNAITGSTICGMGVSGYNNFNCNFEKYEGDPIVADVDKPQRVIDL